MIKQLVKVEEQKTDSDGGVPVVVGDLARIGAKGGVRVVGNKVVATIDSSELNTVVVKWPQPLEQLNR